MTAPTPAGTSPWVRMRRVAETSKLSRNKVVTRRSDGKRGQLERILD